MMATCFSICHPILVQKNEFMKLLNVRAPECLRLCFMVGNIDSQFNSSFDESTCSQSPLDRERSVPVPSLADVSAYRCRSCANLGVQVLTDQRLLN